MHFDKLRLRQKAKAVAQEYWNRAATSDPSLGLDVFEPSISLLSTRRSSQADLRMALQKIGGRLRRFL
jgi:hypothetical protein